MIRRLSLGGFVARGLPNRDDYDMPITNLFRKLLSTGRIEIGHMDINSDTSTIQKCLRLGWLYQEQETDHSTYYLFASPIHFSCIAFSLQPTDELPKFDSLYDLSLEVIKHFKPSQLRVPIRRIAPIAPPGQLTAAPPEAQWQDEFYRATFNVTKGNVRITPEFASARRAEVAGMIDFFIPLKGWGIEITRDGSRFQEHNNRFRDGSAYHAWIESGHMKQYILLDFRTSIPQRAHPSKSTFIQVYPSVLQG